ncbi:MAG: hypothetical protein QXW04_01860 [Candidatus Aenigmatarchaeota archaeon]|nr:hypothetical protein [Candidatus Aenigmarchaeota archaeon]
MEEKREEKKRSDELENVLKILIVLKKLNGWIWIREIARRVNLHHKTVSRILDKYFRPFIEEQRILPFRARLVRLKDNIDEEKFIAYWKIKKLQEIYEKRFK